MKVDHISSYPKIQKHQTLGRSRQFERSGD